ncbi:transport system ATP-binding protein [Corynebacterium kutscheri]|uniref:ABC-type quaternary amine transporter n=1 Tax=Corynebacterium kutscheri TaxID=35755 RepID=A0A0F6QZ28_9CORY|nr:ATP-binding cassette domain-containing protein [Corynebacterium kutscheri]AKE40897.1 ABC-type proline/glycine betaine transport system, ATPase component [Corynebacterium kutscheri]VEH06677.1 transport system ATP-binding protein [Corynebacterium kutscheri]VEH09194.1 transport system ATP-binding protein [Corynebacterium kutscheri]VEH79279.1 transport system ATP-binding protein [Corynebacterium kutscheri]
MIELKNVSHSYDSAGGVSAVTDFSYTIPTGSLTVLLGSSGSGKSTLLNMINAMIRPTHGQVLIDGQDIATQNPINVRRSIGTVLQSPGLLPHKRVIDNVALPAILAGQNKTKAREKALTLITRMGLDESSAYRYPSQLSGGQAQRVGVARALASGAEILLMDEPFGAVDPIQRTQLQMEVKRLHQDLGVTIVFVTHDVDEAFLLADDIVLLKPKAEIAQHGSPQEIMSHPADDFVRTFMRRQLSLRIENSVVYDENGRVVGAIQ